LQQFATCPLIGQSAGLRGPRPRWKLPSCLGQQAVHKSVVVVGIAVVQKQPVDPAFAGTARSFEPATVSPAFFLRQLFRRVLGIVNQHIGAFGQTAHFPVMRRRTRLRVCSENEHRPIRYNPAARTSLGMFSSTHTHNTVRLFHDFGHIHLSGSGASL